MLSFIVHYPWSLTKIFVFISTAIKSPRIDNENSFIEYIVDFVTFSNFFGVKESPFMNNRAMQNK